MSARSMTGFAEVRRRVGDSEAVMSLRAVNHRGLDLHFHLPAGWEAFEAVARGRIKQNVDRGHVQMRVTLDRSAHLPDEEPALDRAALERWARAYREAARIVGSDRQPDPGEGLRFPGVLQSGKSAEWSESLGNELTAALDEALSELSSFREREGAAIALDLQDRTRRLQELARAMESIRAEANAVFHARLREKLSELLRGSAIDPHRLAQEAAILTERSDISEEILRLRTHAAQLLELLATTGEKGKKLDFLLQEMNREANTVLSKTSGLADHGLRLTNLALETKAEIDKMREQSLNLE